MVHLCPKVKWSGFQMVEWSLTILFQAHFSNGKTSLERFVQNKNIFDYFHTKLLRLADHFKTESEKVKSLLVTRYKYARYSNIRCLDGYCILFYLCVAHHRNRKIFTVKFDTYFNYFIEWRIYFIRFYIFSH
jgi:hypothetical protein